jgi:cell division protein FtsI (penicillin-binding protein 3)
MTHQRLSGRRVGVALVVVFLMAGLLVSRLVDVQVVRAAELKEQSADIRTTSEIIWANRGSIVDSFGNDLATDVDRYDVSADPRKVGDFRRDGAVITESAAMAESPTQFSSERRVDDGRFFGSLLVERFR